jgi:dTMP kinase
LIVFEGLDRSGKSTQATLLEQYLNSIGQCCELIRFPNRNTVTGQLIDQYLSQKMDMNPQTIHLLFSTNRWESFEEMKLKLLRGVTLIVDRYVDSGFVYSVAKGLDRGWCRASDVGLLLPDVTFFLSIDPTLTAKRQDYGKERFEKIEFQSKVKILFQECQHVSLDATLSIEKLSGLIQEQVQLIPRSNPLLYIQ